MKIRKKRKIIILNEKNYLQDTRNFKFSYNIVQQDLNNTIKSEYNNTLLKLQKKVKRLKNSFFQQINVENFL